MPLHLRFQPPCYGPQTTDIERSSHLYDTNIWLGKRFICKLLSSSMMNRNLSVVTCIGPWGQFLRALWSSQRVYCACSVYTVVLLNPPSMLFPWIARSIPTKVINCIALCSHAAIEVMRQVIRIIVWSENRKGVMKGVHRSYYMFSDFWKQSIPCASRSCFPY